jgi:hypothetical protein
MNCPFCDQECVREEVDIGVGTLNGPWRCDHCGWAAPDPTAGLFIDDDPPFGGDDFEDLDHGGEGG